MIIEQLTKKEYLDNKPEDLSYRYGYFYKKDGLNYMVSHGMDNNIYLRYS
jgi:predicted transcriptional regulator